MSEKSIPKKIATGALAVGLGVAAYNGLKKEGALMPTDEGVKDPGYKVESANTGAHLMSSKTGKLHKVTLHFGPHGRIWDKVDQFNGQNLNDASGKITSYLHGRELQPNDTLTVEVNSEGHVVEDPTINSGE